MQNNSSVKAILFDLEGTIYFKGQLIAGASDALDQLSDWGIRRRFLSNIDSKNRQMLRDELQAMGLELEAAEIFTAASAALAFLQQQAQQRCYPLLPRLLLDDFAPYIAQAEATVDYVVVGDIRDCLSYHNLNTAFRHLRAGATLLALQKGRYFVRSDGEYLDTGAFVELLEYASGQAAVVVGKPSASFFELALGDLGCSPDEVVVVGDDLTTDIPGAHSIGARSILVRTGKFLPEALEQVGLQPTCVVDSVADVPRLLEGWQGL